MKKIIGYIILITLAIIFVGILQWVYIAFCEWWWLWALFGITILLVGLVTTAIAWIRN